MLVLHSQLQQYSNVYKSIKKNSVQPSFIKYCDTREQKHVISYN